MDQPSYVTHVPPTCHTYGTPKLPIRHQQCILYATPMPPRGPPACLVPSEMSALGGGNSPQSPRFRGRMGPPNNLVFKCCLENKVLGNKVKHISCSFGYRLLAIWSRAALKGSAPCIMCVPSFVSLRRVQRADTVTIR